VSALDRGDALSRSLCVLLAAAVAADVADCSEGGGGGDMSSTRGVRPFECCRCIRSRAVTVLAYAPCCHAATLADIAHNSARHCARSTSPTQRARCAAARCDTAHTARTRDDNNSCRQQALRRLNSSYDQQRSNRPSTTNPDSQTRQVMQARCAVSMLLASTRAAVHSNGCSVALERRLALPGGEPLLLLSLVDDAACVELPFPADDERLRIALTSSGGSGGACLSGIYYQRAEAKCFRLRCVDGKTRTF
jgi:hypothetical protein